MDGGITSGTPSLEDFVARMAARREAEIARRTLPFELSEYEGRLRRLRRAMGDARIDTLLLSRPESMCWLSGYAARWYRHAGPKDWVGLVTVAVRAEGDDIVHFDFAGEEDMIALTSVATEVCILPESEETLRRFIDELKARDLARGVVGREMRSCLPDHLTATALEDGLRAAGATVIDASDLVDGLLHIKSPAEIASIEEAVRVCDIGVRAAQRAIAPGVTELEVWAEMMRAMVAAGGEPAGIHEMVMSGPTFLPHIISRRRKIERGDLVAVDPCGVVNRYHGNVSRTFSVGEPPAELLESSRSAGATIELFCDAATAGSTVDAVAAALGSQLHEAGLWNDRYFIGGYDLGIAFPPDWVGAWYFDLAMPMPGRVFKAGMVTNLEVVSNTVALVDTVLYGEDGARVVSSVARELLVVEG
jgi:Xaa-Pro dipeptidase